MVPCWTGHNQSQDHDQDDRDGVILYIISHTAEISPCHRAHTCHSQSELRKPSKASLQARLQPAPIISTIECNNLCLSAALVSISILILNTKSPRACVPGFCETLWRQTWLPMNIS